MGIDTDIVNKANLDSPVFQGVPSVPTATDNNLTQIVNVEYLQTKIDNLIDNANDEFATLGRIEAQLKKKSDKIEPIEGELVSPPVVGDGLLTIKLNGSTIGSFNANNLDDKIVEIPVELSKYINDVGFKTTDHNTTYTLSGENRKIILNASDGTSSSYSIPEYLSINGGTITGLNGETPLEIKSNGSNTYVKFINSANSILGSYGFNSLKEPVINIEDNIQKIYHTGNLSIASTDMAGLMSAKDKEKLNSIDINATAYTPPEYNNYDTDFYKIKTNIYGHVIEAIKITAKDISNILGFTPSQNDHVHLYAGSSEVGGAANSVANPINFTIGGVSHGSYDGSALKNITIEALDLKISGALRYIGRTTTYPNGAFIQLVDHENLVEVENGNVVIYINNDTHSTQEYLYELMPGQTEGEWIPLGEATSFSLTAHSHGQIDSAGILTDLYGIPKTNTIVITNSEGRISDGPNIEPNVESNEFLNKNGAWQQVSVDNYYHTTGDWSDDQLTYTATSHEGAPEFSFTLFKATDEQNGVVKIGENITQTDGVISITKANILKALDYIPAKSNDENGLSAIAADKLMVNGGTEVLPVYFKDGVPTQINSSGVEISITGSAAKWQSERTITLTGDVAGSIVLDGSKDVEVELRTTASAQNGYIFREDITVNNSSSQLNLPITIATLLSEGANLQLYQNGLLLVQDEHYILNDSKTTVLLQGFNFEEGDTFTFISISGIGFQSEDLKNSVFLPKSGGVMTGALTLAGNPVNDFHPATKYYTDSSILQLSNNISKQISALDDIYVKKEGDTVKGELLLYKKTSIAKNEPAKITFQIEQTDNNVSSKSYIAVYDDLDANNYGNNMVVATLSGLYLAAGEGAASYLDTNPSTSEQVHVCADGTIHFHTNCNTVANATSTVSITTGGVLMGAAWNDYAEFRIADIHEPGRCIVELGDDTLKLATSRMQPGAAIISDTFGFAIGETVSANTPIAVSGRVLAYGYEDRETFRNAIGRPVCSGPNGTVSIMTDEEYQRYGYCAIGTISAVPEYKTWGEKNIPVNNRIWIKVV